jgi:hypothetical protein
MAKEVAQKQHITWGGGSFADRESAEQAYQTLLERGYDGSEISVLMSDETRSRYFSDKQDETEFGAKAIKSGESEVAKGSLRGATIGTILAFGANLILPGVGLLVGGPLFVGLGAVTGGLAAALAEKGIPEEEAETFEADAKNGRIVIGVTPRNQEDAQFFEREWKRL